MTTLIAVGVLVAAAWLLLATPAAARRVRALRGPGSAATKHGSGGADGARLVRSPLLASALAGLGVGALIGGVPGLLGGALAAGGAAWWIRGLPGAAALARGQAVAAATADALELLALAIEVGVPPAQASRIVSVALGDPLGPALAAYASLTDLGAPPEQAALGLLTTAETRQLGRTLVRAARRGSSPVAELRAAAETARADLRAAALGQAKGLGARAAVPMGLCFLPAFLLVTVPPLVTSGLGDWVGP